MRPPNWEKGTEGANSFTTDPYSEMYDEILQGLKDWETHCQATGHEQAPMELRKGLFTEGRYVSRIVVLLLWS